MSLRTGFYFDPISLQHATRKPTSSGECRSSAIPDGSFGSQRDAERFRKNADCIQSHLEILLENPF